MVRFTRLPAFLSLAVLATMFLSYSVESAADEGKMKCKHSSKTMKYPKESMKTVIVILKPGAHQHEKWLKDCWNIRTVPADHSQGVSSLSEEDDVAVNFSVEGEESVNGYFVKVPHKFFKEQIVPRDDVDVAEVDGPVKINYAVPQLTKRTIVVNPLPNLDRIDQARLPLDKKYIFPNSAGKGVNVFIVDTGIDIKHVQFEGRARIGGRFCTGPGCNTDRDDHGHGSHVAGTVGGKTVGVARKVNLIAVKVLDATGHGSFAGIIDGLQFVLAQHKKSKNKNSVVNMSLGGGLSDAINKVVQSLVKAGIHVVVAAGNDHQDACNTSPASAPGAVTVAALENTSDQLTDFSNFGRCVKIVGPGRNVLSVGANTHNKFAVFSGTSQATPHVAGTIALIIAKQGNQSPAKMVKTLDNLSTKNVIKQSTLLGTPNRLVRVPKP